MTMGGQDTYLGDGVYASYDGYYIWLDLRGQDNTTKIALEPPVFLNLLAFKAKVTKRKGNNEDEKPAD